MSEAKITEQLRRRLDEVGLVYEQLPISLDRALKVTDAGPWSSFFLHQSKCLKHQLGELRATTAHWNKRTRPFFSSVVNEQLNEALHAIRSRRSQSAMERRMIHVLDVLRVRVLTCLREAIELAQLIREDELAARLQMLLQAEGDHRSAMHAAVASPDQALGTPPRS